MTTLGKILAIVNLVLSLFVGAFIVMSYVARTHWHAAYERADAQLKVALQDANAYKDEATNAQKTITSLQNEVKNKDKLVSDTKLDLGAQLADMNKKLQLLNQGLGVSDQEKIALTEHLTRVQSEVTLLRAKAQQRDTELAERDKKAQDASNHAVEMEIAFNASNERNQRLLTQLEKLTQALKKAEVSGSTTHQVSKQNPPSEEIHGRVTETDKEKGLVVISVGTDQGVNVGNTLEVFRLKPATYLGTIKILQARHDVAVGRPTSPLRVPIQVGDEVATSVMTKRYSDLGNGSPR